MLYLKLLIFFLCVIGFATLIGEARSEELPKIAGKAKVVPLDDLFLQTWDGKNEIGFRMRGIPYALIEDAGKGPFVIIMRPHSNGKKGKYVYSYKVELDHQNGFRPQHMKRIIVLLPDNTLGWTELSEKEIMEIKRERKEREMNR